jgi:hypothetical protein
MNNRINSKSVVILHKKLTPVPKENQQKQNLHFNSTFYHDSFLEKPQSVSRMQASLWCKYCEFFKKNLSR